MRRYRVQAILLLLTGTFFASCIEVNTSGYSDLTESERLHVMPCKKNLAALENDGFLYQVTVKQVQTFIQGIPRILIYEYLPFCPGENGRAPMEVKRFCDSNGLNFLVISTVYDGIFPMPSTNTFPLFVIDHRKYKTDNYQDYGEAFYSQLTGCNDELRQRASYHLFCYGKYVRSFTSLTDLDLNLKGN